MNVKSISKILSSNDIGATGAHQAGMHVPKQVEILSFFPKIDKYQKNPRYLLIFTDDSDERWEFCFIYYNNAFFGGTRNEYRLTRMTKYIRMHNLQVGDQIVLTNKEDGVRRISFIRKTRQSQGKLKLSSEWKVIQY